MQQSSRGYQGLACPCAKCQSLTDEEREAKHDRITEARRQGGRTSAAQPSMNEARSAGFWVTMELHPYFARNWLKKKIKRQNEQRQRKTAMPSLIAGQPAGRRQPMK